MNHQSPLAIEASPQPLMIEGPKVSTDLVPVSYDKQAWNELRQAIIPGVEPLPYHGGNLTSEQATRINEHYDIELNFGIHGFGLNTKPEGMLHAEGLPTQREYEAAKQVVDGLQEGDTLFIERAGFSSNPTQPMSLQQLIEFKATLDAVAKLRPKDMLELAAFNTLKVIGGSLLQVGAKVKLDQSTHDILAASTGRDNYLTSAWTYAAALARAKGVTVRYADKDYYDQMKLQEMTGKSGDELMMSNEPVDQLHFYRDLKQRDKAARNVVKDFALDNLPPEGTPPPTGRKPKLSVLFGNFHKNHMTQSFEDLGLKVNVNELASSTANERALEHIARDLQPLFAKVMRQVLGSDIFHDMIQGFNGPNDTRTQP